MGRTREWAKAEAREKEEEGAREKSRLEL